MAEFKLPYEGFGNLTKLISMVGMIVSVVLFLTARYSHSGKVCSGGYLPDGERTEEELETYDIFLG